MSGGQLSRLIKQRKRRAELTPEQKAERSRKQREKRPLTAKAKAEHERMIRERAAKYLAEHPNIDLSVHREGKE